jgi:hypothetical protein
LVQELKKKVAGIWAQTNIFNIHIWLWVYQMKVIPKLIHGHYIRNLIYMFISTINMIYILLYITKFNVFFNSNKLLSNML